MNLNVDDIAAGIDVSDNLIAWALEQPADYPVLIYASADPDEVGQMQARYGAERAGKMVEDVLAAAAIGLVAQGFSQLLVAGGETSGAVVTALGIDALRIGPQIDPGVPWTESTSAPRVALALKSGNFGGEDFFEKAFTMLS